jgi:hypothetical protein
MEKTKQNVGLKLSVIDITKLRAEAELKRMTLSGLLKSKIFKDEIEKAPSN